MRNLKRVLSLALALVMMLGMMIVGASAASADFPDAAEINYTEAVDVISGLGIMVGNETGNFNPKDILTRAMAAKILCYTLIGEENAEKLGNNTQIFVDVPATHWAAGYIAYCTNLGILAGDGNGYFRPEDNLTGVQFGKMLLVAAGYDANVEGYAYSEDWATNIATDMIDNKLDISGVILSDELTREQAAQMLLQAMDVKTVTYTTGNVIGLVGPFDAGQTFAEKYFPKLDKFEGVVIANEYAALDDDAPLAAGKTKIGTKTYKGSTELTDIGEGRRGWANDGTILFITASNDNNVVLETGAATEINAKFKKANGITDDTEWYINFGENADVWTSDYRIRYELSVYVTDADVAATEVKGDEVQTVKAVENAVAAVKGDADVMEITAEDIKTVTGGIEYTYSVAFKAGAEIGVGHQANIKAIFNYADRFKDGYVYGEVYVGTTSLKDVSDTLSYKEFLAEYIEDGTSADQEFTKTGNGEWLKVIDNDGDGEADYIFLTQFTLDEVKSVSKKGAVTLQTGDAISADDLVASEELAKGDVVITTLIDGITYITPAPTFTGTVDSYSMKNDILTVEGEEYGQSGIGNNTTYFDDISDAQKKTEYTYYQDFFGYIRAYAYPGAAAGQYVLLTDGWYNETRTADEYAVKAYLDGEIQDIDVNAKSTGDFIDDGAATQNNSWGNLNGFGYYTYDLDNRKATAPTDTTLYGVNSRAITNIAAYALNDGVLSLSTVKTYNYSNKHVAESIDVDYVALDKVDLAKGASDYAGAYAVNAYELNVTTQDDDGNYTDPNVGDDITVQATKNTVFYYVTTETKKGVTSVKSIKEVVGYKNSLAVDGDNIRAAYAVATNTSEDKNGVNYWVADVIVVELLSDTVSYEDVFLNVYGTQKNVRDIVTSDAILASGETGEVIADLDNNYDGYIENGTLRVDFYEKTAADEDGVAKIAPVTDYAAKGIYTAVADRVQSLLTYLTTSDGKRVAFNEDTAVVYALTGNKTDKYGVLQLSAVTEVNEKDVRIAAGDELIVVCNNKSLDKVSYAIIVNKSVNNKNVEIQDVRDLYEAIKLANAVAPATTGTVNDTEGKDGATITVQVSTTLNGKYVKVTDDSDNSVTDTLLVENGKVVVPVTGGVDKTVNTATGYYRYTEGTDDAFTTGDITAAAGTYAVAEDTNGTLVVLDGDDATSKVTATDNDQYVVTPNLVQVTVQAGNRITIRVTVYQDDGTTVTEETGVLFAGTYYVPRGVVFDGYNSVTLETNRYTANADLTI